VYIVDKHHQVLEAWELFAGTNIFSLDYHNDSKLAFLQKSFYTLRSEQPANGRPSLEDLNRWADGAISQYKRGEKPISECIADLKYDEHPDFAVRSGIVRRFFVLAMDDGNVGEMNKRVFDDKFQTEFSDHQIVIYAPTCVPGCTSSPHDEPCRYKRANSVLESAFLDQATNYIAGLDPVFFNRYLLDIDLDYFNTAHGLKPNDISTFHSLIQGAEAVTIAMEHSCVISFRLPGETIEAEGVLDRLMSVIEAALVNG